MNKEALENRMMFLKKEFNNFINRIREYKYVCLFGTGRFAEHWGYKFVREWGTDNIICFSDNNPDMWGKVIVDGLTCISPEKISEFGRDILCVILVHESTQNEIIKQLNAQHIEALGVKTDWLYIDDLVEKYLDMKLPGIWEKEFKLGEYNRTIDNKERIAVFTCIENGYDDLQQPLVCDPQCDYYCLSMEKPDNLGIFRWLDITETIPQYLTGDYTRINRYCKLHPNLFFQKYKYSIYVDGRVLIHKELKGLIKKIGKTGIASYGMPSFIANTFDTYETAASLCYLEFKGEKPEVIRTQMQTYAAEGFPRYFGLTENTIIVREHHNEKCIRIMETWWNEIKNFSRRDQLSFFYSIWKNGFTGEDIGCIDVTFRNGPEFSVKPFHNKDLNMKRFNKY
jgi:hypothetical protein